MKMEATIKVKINVFDKSRFLNITRDKSLNERRLLSETKSLKEMLEIELIGIIETAIINGVNVEPLEVIIK